MSSGWAYANSYLRNERSVANSTPSQAIHICPQQTDLRCPVIPTFLVSQ
jgi:hypothetical protein